MRSENHELENLRDQYKQLSMEQHLAIQNRDMFRRLWKKWRIEERKLSVSLDSIDHKIEEMKRHPQ